MEWIKRLRTSAAGKERYVCILLFLVLGIVLMTLPEKEEIPAVVPAETAPDLQSSLGALLSKVHGAGKVEVLLTERAGEEYHYQQNEDTGPGDQRKDTVLITNGSREETGLVRRVDPPTYQGAVILCQGADSAQVRLCLVEAVKLATGLSADRITVLKMK